MAKRTNNKHSLHDDLNHFPQLPMAWSGAANWFGKSRAVFSRSKAVADAILFVHGWGGSAGETWETFPQAIASLQEAASADVFFLDYPSTKSQVAFCAAQLRMLLRDLVRRPNETIVTRSLPGLSRADYRYRRIIVVAHSMGAVISRRALLDLDSNDGSSLTDAELAKFHLLLFAPAHCGSEIPLLIGSGFGLDFVPGAALVGAMLKFWFQSLRDLQEDSPALMKLAEDNRERRGQRTTRAASVEHLRAHVYHAHHDRVVSQNAFDADYPFNPVMQQSHRSICKPDVSYTTPIEALRALLQNKDA